MSARSLRSMTLAVALALGAPLVAFAAGPQGPNGPGTQVLVPYVAPTAEEAADLTYMREEEKVARDLYLEFYDAWGTAPFASIASSEQKHMDAVLRMLIKYRLPDPAAGALIGEFTDPRLVSLYATLHEKGLESEISALLVGGLVEETDLRDLAAAAARTDKVDIDQVYDNLACGSRNHLREFARSVEAVTGQAYIAQTMPQEAVDAILALPSERCGKGQGQGQGQGRVH